MSKVCPHCGKGFQRLASHEWRCKEKGTAVPASSVPQSRSSGSSSTKSASARKSPGRSTTPSASVGNSAGRTTTPSASAGRSAERSTTPSASEGKSAGRSTTPSASAGKSAGRSITPSASAGNSAGRSSTPSASAGKSAGRSTTPSASAGNSVGRSATPSSSAGKGAGRSTTPSASAGNSSGRSTTPSASSGKSAGRSTIPSASAGKSAGRSTTPSASAGNSAGQSTTPSASVGNSAGRTTTPSASAGKRAWRSTTPSASVGNSAGRTTTPSASAGRSAERSTTPSASEGKSAGRSTTPSASAGKSAGRSITPSASAGNSARRSTTPSASAGKSAGRSTTPSASAGNSAGRSTTPSSSAGNSSGRSTTPSASSGKSAGRSTIPSASAGNIAGRSTTPSVSAGEGAGRSTTPSALTGKSAKQSTTPSASVGTIAGAWRSDDATRNGYVCSTDSETEFTEIWEMDALVKEMVERNIIRNSDNPKKNIKRFFENEVKMEQKDIQQALVHFKWLRERIVGQLNSGMNFGTWKACNAGSHFDGTKVARPNEMDCTMFPILQTKLEAVFDDTCEVGTCKVKVVGVVDDHEEDLRLFLDGGFVNSKKFRIYVFEKLERVLETDRKLKGARKFKDSQSFAVKYEGIPSEEGMKSIDIDFVPSLNIKPWPRKNVSRDIEDILPDQAKAASIKENGFNVTPKQQNQGNDPDLLWQVSFSYAEKAITKHADKISWKPSLRTWKRVLEIAKGNSDCCAKGNSPELVQIQEAVRYVKEHNPKLRSSRLTTYHIRTLMWWQLYGLTAGEHVWRQETMATRFQDCLRKFQKMMAGEIVVPHFFLPQIKNILPRMHKEERAFLYVIAKATEVVFTKKQ
ncbi:nucleoporin NSP1-like [Haliotis rufescens]|uniref:nucleoporin NSP1-like n=1 Tax=Haliotis rufescens TaxID=6454 RepID=UPI00201F741A|nr:nucleoporin NSP1-like [Haliotis rufescens]XP_048256498.1 nucleoporin NSP1-like [Haliotis rufescens]